MRTIAVGLVVFAIVIVAESAIGGYSFCYAEHWTTFFFDTDHISYAYFHIGGVAQLIADFLTQFFVGKWVANILMSALLSAVAMLSYAMTTKQATTWANAPLSIAIATCVGLLSHSTDWSLAGTVALLLCLLCLFFRTKKTTHISLWIHDIVCIALLFIIAGPIAVLYVLCAIICSTKKTEYIAKLLIFSTITISVALYQMHSGAVGEWHQALTPMGYSDHRSSALWAAWLPWVGVLLLLVSNDVFLFFAIKKEKAQVAINAFLMLLLCIVSGVQCINHNQELFKRFSHLSREADWQGIISACGGKPSRNILVQNCINEAWAATGELGNHVLDNPESNMSTLLSANIESGYVAAQMSDIYYLMGHIAQARRYAFEANEYVGGLSPRLLQRLTLTAIVLRQYNEAKKYIKLLSHTLFYAHWAQQMQALLTDEAVSANTELSNMHQCVPSSDAFCNAQGVNYDLADIMRSNPTNIATAQYLAATMMFLGNKEEYVAIIDEMQANGALPTILQKHFRQAYLMAKQAH